MLGQAPKICCIKIIKRTLHSKPTYFWEEARFAISGRTNPITASVWLGIKAGCVALLSIQICVPLQEQKESTDAKRKHLGKETEKAKHLASSF